MQHAAPHRVGWWRWAKHRLRLYPHLPLIMMNSHNSPTELPVRQVYGLMELVWTIRNWWWQRNSPRWQSISATVRALEFLRFSTNAGWLSVSYTFTVADQLFSGELRKWIISKKTSKAESDPDTIDFSKRFRVDSQILVRVDPDQPVRSVVDQSNGLIR
jgi:hypothetical protein